MAKKKKNKPDQVNEPETAYINKSIHIFSSFEKAEEYEDEENAKHTPLEHIQWTTDLIERVYAEKLKGLINPYKKINFIEYEYLD